MKGGEAQTGGNRTATGSRTRGFAVAWLAALLIVAAAAPGAAQPAEPDVFAYVRAMDEAGSRAVWPGFNPASSPIALFDGRRTVLLRHPNPPPPFAPVPDRPGVFEMPGRHPAVAANSTRELAGIRTATVMATPGQPIESTLLACIEEVFHVFWLQGHAAMRPNEMDRYAYPITDARTVRSLLAEEEALARALDAAAPADAAAWAAAAFRCRRERAGRLTDDVRTYETFQEMMEGTANYVARVSVGLPPSATAARLRAPRRADLIRWRFYDTGTALCLLLDRLAPDWKTQIERDPARTTTAWLAKAVDRQHVRPAVFTAAEWSAFEQRASADIAELAARRQQVRDDLVGRGGARIIVDTAAGSEPLELTRFDPINLLLLGEGQVAHPNSVAFARQGGTVEVTNAGFSRGSFAGLATLTIAAGPHPLSDGIRALVIVGISEVPVIQRDTGRVIISAPGVRLSFPGATVREEGQTIRVTLPSRAADRGPIAESREPKAESRKPMLSSQ